MIATNTLDCFKNEHPQSTLTYNKGSQGFRLQKIRSRHSQEIFSFCWFLMKAYISEKRTKIWLLLVLDFFLLIFQAGSDSKIRGAANKIALQDISNQAWCSPRSVEQLRLDPTLRYTHRNGVLTSRCKRKRQKTNFGLFAHTQNISRCITHPTKVVGIH